MAKNKKDVTDKLLGKKPKETKETSKSITGKLMAASKHREAIKVSKERKEQLMTTVKSDRGDIYYGKKKKDKKRR